MTDFSRARLNMVNAQLATNGIHAESLIEAYKALPREEFADEAQRPFVYVDEDQPFKGGKRWLLEPMVEARMVQAVLDEPALRALVLGVGGLPAAVMLAQFIENVCVAEPDAELAAQAKARLAAHSVNNVSIVETAYREGYGPLAPYDIIFAPGAVSGICPLIVGQLARGGRFACVLRETPRAQGRIVVAQKLADDVTDIRIVADAATPYLAGFEPAQEFVF